LIFGGKQMYVLHKQYQQSNSFFCRSDDKSASEYNIEGGSVLHLVLALRGGC
jgi:hypothetical protein